MNLRNTLLVATAGILAMANSAQAMKCATGSCATKTVSAALATPKAGTRAEWTLLYAQAQLAINGLASKAGAERTAAIADIQAMLAKLTDLKQAARSAALESKLEAQLSAPRTTRRPAAAAATSARKEDHKAERTHGRAPELGKLSVDPKDIGHDGGLTHGASMSPTNVGRPLLDSVLRVASHSPRHGAAAGSAAAGLTRGASRSPRSEGSKLDASAELERLSGARSASARARSAADMSLDEALAFCASARAKIEQQISRGTLTVDNRNAWINATNEFMRNWHGNVDDTILVRATADSITDMMNRALDLAVH